MEKFDIAVLGSGPGGYVAALYAAQLGNKVCVVEEGQIGGVCLNCGCIPTKTFAASARRFADVKNAGVFGIRAESISLDFSQVAKRRKDIIERLKKGIEFLLKSRNVTVFKGRGTLIERHVLEIGGTKNIEFKNLIIATGSSPIHIPSIKTDGRVVLTSKDMLEADTVPKSLAIVGGGVIGCEFASIFSSFGAHISIIEMTQHLIPGADAEVAKRLEGSFKKRGVAVLTGVKANDVKVSGLKEADIAISDGRRIKCDKVLICIGRSPNVENIGLEKAGIAFDRKGIKVDASLRTSADNIYAIGDCIGGYMLAHAASYEAIVACNNINGKEQKTDYKAVPNCIFTEPEIASCGVSESSAKDNSMDVKVSKFQFRSLGKAHILNNTEGFIKLVTDNKTDRLIGVDIMGSNANELIAEAALAIKMGLKSSELAETIHAHPTMAESVLEAAHTAAGTPIHSL